MPLTYSVSYILSEILKNCMDHGDPLVINYGKNLNIAFCDLMALFRDYLDIREINKRRVL